MTIPMEMSFDAANPNKNKNALNQNTGVCIGIEKVFFIDIIRYLINGNAKNNITTPEAIQEISAVVSTDTKLFLKYFKQLRITLPGFVFPYITS